ncbi:MAG: hypothetical protein ACYS6W_17610, partial [Planctomycetota bacterium]
LDLTTAGSSGTINGAFFEQWDGQPTGTGVFDPFLRIQRDPPPPYGTEAGYNTDGTTEFQTKEFGGHNWCHSLPVSLLIPVTIGGTSYYQFTLDVDETSAQGGNTGPLLSLDELRIHLAASGDLSGYPNPSIADPTTFEYGLFGDPIYDLNPAGEENWILLDYSLNHGNGSGDMIANIPTSLFTGGDYVYLYSQFGLSHNGYKSAGRLAAKT